MLRSTGEKFMLSWTRRRRPPPLFLVLSFLTEVKFGTSNFASFVSLVSWKAAILTLLSISHLEISVILFLMPLQFNCRIFMLKLFGGLGWLVGGGVDEGVGGGAGGGDGGDGDGVGGGGGAWVVCLVLCVFHVGHM